MGQYFRLLALSEVNGNPWASAAEFSMVGCTDIAFGYDQKEIISEINAFPVPTSGFVTVSVPSGANIRDTITSVSGQVIRKGMIENPSDPFSLDLGEQRPGIYYIQFVDDRGIVYTAKVIKR